MQRHGDESDVEQREIPEEAKGIVHAGGEQLGSEETAEDAENGDDLRLQPHRENKRRRRDQRHQQERRHRPEELEVVDRPAGECDRVERHDARADERLRRRGEAFAREEHSAHDQAGAENETDGDAQLRRNPAVVERVFD